MSATFATSLVKPTLSQAFWYWLKLGCISFGGPSGQIAVMHQQLVDEKRWISDRRFLHALNYCMLLPGPEAQQLATYIGWLMHGYKGGLVAGALFILPSLLMLIALSYIYIQYAHVAAVAAVLYAIKPAVVAIVIFAAFRIASRVLNHLFFWLVALSSLIAIAVLKLPFPFVIMAAAAAGWLANYYNPSIFTNNRLDVEESGAIIDDNPTVLLAPFTLKHALKVALTGVGIGMVVMFGLVLMFGWDAVYVQMAWFFTKAALLTFGGAYAVLPYVYQGATEYYAWLTPVQMMDGLALGETTPGPLVMVVAFVGFIGGWLQGVVGSPLLSAVLATLIVVFFTFLPSFIFIFSGAPLIESSQGNAQLNAPLTTITAAVVGVIASLTVFFAQHTFLPSGLHAPDWLAIILAAFGVLALVRFKLSVIKLVVLYATFGLLSMLVL